MMDTGYRIEHNYSQSSKASDSPSCAKRQLKNDDECSMKPTGDLCLYEDVFQIKQEPLEIIDDYSETESVHSIYQSSSPSQIIQESDVDLDGPADISLRILPNGQNAIITRGDLRQGGQRAKLSANFLASGAFALPPTPPCFPNSGDESEDSPPQLTSNQRYKSSQVLLLTELEKRTLVEEGYSIPTHLPLTRPEELSLKHVRRRIKNRISAQASRKRKKELVYYLESQVKDLIKEKGHFQDTIASLQKSNGELIAKVRKLQGALAVMQQRLLRE